MQFHLFVTLTAALCAGIAVTCLALAAFNLMQMIQVDKLEDVAEIKQLPLLIKMMKPFAGNLTVVTGAGFLSLTRNRAEELIQMAGYDQTITGEEFIAIRILDGVLGILIFLWLNFIGQGGGGLIIAALLIFYPGLWLKATVKKRHLEILKALPNVLDLLTLSVEAGKDFITATRDILARRRIDALGEELRRTLHEIQLGKPRQTALKEMSNRVRQPELTSVLNAIIQAEELGVSIGQLLRIQGDQLRNKRFSRAEKLANEAPVKILFPMVIFIFPAVFLILMAPIILQALKTLR